MKTKLLKKVPLVKPVNNKHTNFLIPSSCPSNKDECKAAQGCFCK